MKNRYNRRKIILFSLMSCTLFPVVIIFLYYAYPLIFKSNSSALFYYYYYSFILHIEESEHAYNFSTMMAESKKIEGYKSDLDYSTIFKCANQTSINQSSPLIELRDIYSVKLPNKNYAISVVAVYKEPKYTYVTLISFVAEIDRKPHTCNVIDQHRSSMG
jgi:hypothetical protein